MINPESIGKKIASLRKQINLKQNELADTLFVTHQAVSKWENGKSIPSIEILYEMTKLFNVSIDYLLDDSEIKNDDYEALLKHFSRETVINQFLKEEDLDEKIDKILYLLNKKERLLIINMIIGGKKRIKTNRIWHLLSKDERIYLLGSLLKSHRFLEVEGIANQLTFEEAGMLQKMGYKGNIHIRVPNSR